MVFNLISHNQQKEKIEVKLLQLFKQRWAAGITEIFTESSG